MPAMRIVLNLILGAAALLLACVGAGAAIAAQWGRVDLRFDLLAQFAPVWLVLSAAAMTLGFLVHRALRALVAVPSIAGICFALALIVPEFVRDAGPKAPNSAPGKLKVVQFNVWSRNPDPDAVLRWLDAEEPDIAVIEETSPGFMAALERHPHWQVACGKCEVLMLSRKRALLAEPAYRGGGDERIGPLTHAVFSDAGGRFNVIGIHHEWPTDPDQRIQERRLASIIAKLPRDRVIVAGDFNSTPWSFSRRRWDETFAIPRRDRAIPSWPARTYGRLRWAGSPFLPIDHVYAGPAWATVDIHRGPRLSSDHYPLVVTLAPVAPR